MTRPSLILVPGSFALPEYYDPMFEKLRAKGVDIRGIHLPSVGLRTLEGRPGPPPTMYDDAAFIAKEVEKEADAGKDVVVIGHSYGGVPVSQFPQGLSKAQRQEQGKPGGLVALAYLTCLVPALGESAMSVLAFAPPENKTEMDVDETGWMWHSAPEKTAAICLNHLSPEEGTAWIKRFPRHSAVSFTNELTYAGYKDVPVSWLFCEEDLCILPHMQKRGIEIIEKASGRKVHVTSLKADHCPNVTSETDTVNWLIDVAARAASDA